MNHIKTYTWGDWADDLPVDVSKSSQYFMRYFQTKSWCDCIHIPGRAIFNHQLSFDVGTERSEACVIISDPNNVFTTLNYGEAIVTNFVFMDFVINKFKSPKGHFKLSVFTTDKEFGEQPWSCNFIWPLIGAEKNKSPSYLSFHPTPTNLTSENYNEAQLQYNPHYVNRDVAIDFAVEDSIGLSGWRYSKVGYHQHPELQYKLVSESEAHVSYVGGTYWLAAALNKPIVQYGYLVGKNNSKDPYHKRHGRVHESISDINIVGGIHRYQEVEDIGTECLKILVDL